MEYQTTLEKPINLVGIEPYGGNRVNVRLLPAGENSGYVFRTRTREIGARLGYAGNSRRSVHLSDGRVSISHVEHILATLRAYDVDNVVINLEREPSLSFRTMDRLGLATREEVFPIFPEMQKTLCDAIETSGVVEQLSSRRIFKLKETFCTGKLLFEPTSNGRLTMRAITNYSVVGVQEKEIIVNPNSFYSISKARSYQSFFPWWVPKSVMSLAATVAFPSFGLGHGITRENVFLPPRTKEQWRAQEIMKNEIACHTIIDRLGAFALIGKISGVKVTCNGSGHQHDIETLRNYRDYFVEK
jgi:UDP-3-O-acyl-N-acetylglucosamine deacetylase